MKPLALVKKSYQRSLSVSARAKLWRLRAKLRAVSSAPRHLKFRFTGRCNVCRGKKLAPFRNPAVATIPYRFYRCADCEYIFVWPPPDTPSMAHYETVTMPEFGAGEAIWNRHYLEAINKHAGVKGRLLETGFGNASFLKLARDDGWQVFGTELSVPLVESAREEFGVPNIELGTIQTVTYPDGYFDVICGFNFLEHVPDPRRTLEDIFRLLRPSGLVAVMCPNIVGIFHLLMPEILGDNDPLKITWCPPEHISYFNKRNLKMLLESVGFAEVADESSGMGSLWRQFEPQIGPDVTAEKLKALVLEIQSSPNSGGDAKVAEYRSAIKKLLIERMTWTMLSDLIELEPALGAEVGVLLVGRKPA